MENFVESKDEHWKGTPFYATYSFWILLSLVVIALVVTLDLSIKVYRLYYAMDVIWNNTMNTSFYDMIRQAKPPIEDFIPFR